MKKVFTFIVGSIVVMSVSVVHAQSLSSCVILSTDETSGAVDSLYPGPIILLQNYLVQAGYLNAKPNGHFGPATKLAVKAFQKAHNIPTTGTVGPLTRATLQKESCSTSTHTTTITQTISQPPTTINNPLTIISPASGDTLIMGKTYSIIWNTPTNYPHNIVLEQVGGAGAGFIANNVSGGSSYSWQAGSVFSTAAQMNQTVATGTYRIRIESTSGGVTNSDPVSGWFTLIGPPLSITSVSPLSIVADGRSTGALYGTGFDAKSIVYLDQQYGVPATIQYVSADGTIIVFSIPVTTTPGAHNLFVRNQYAAVSNIINISVTAPTAQ